MGTDVFDIKDCQVLRKVDVGETLEVVGEAKKDSAVEISRLEFKAIRDGKTGWVTLRGNQGTIFMEQSTSHYVLAGDAILRSSAARSSTTVRELQKGETVEATEAPREDLPDSHILAKVRAVENSEVGWLCWAKGSKRPPLRPWPSKYICKAPVDLSSNFDAGSGGSLKRAEAGETLECIDGPFLDKVSGVRRGLFVGQDSIAAWANLSDSGGVQLLEPVS